MLTLSNPTWQDLFCDIRVRDMSRISLLLRLIYGLLDGIPVLLRMMYIVDSHLMAETGPEKSQLLHLFLVYGINPQPRLEIQSPIFPLYTLLQLIMTMLQMEALE